jgi:hypothetical protein
MPVEYMKKSATRILRVKGMPTIRACGLLWRADVPMRPIVAEFAATMRMEMARLQQQRALLPII